MAEVRRNWRTWFAVGALCLGAHRMVCAQTAPDDSAPLRSVEIQSSPTGSLAGRLTDLRSAPLSGVSVILHNQATGAEVHAVTAKNGAFRFAQLDAGEYTLEADQPRLGHGHLEGILVTGGMEARVQAAMHFAPAAPILVEATAPSQITAPPRFATLQTLPALAASGASMPEAGLPLPTVSHAALSTSNPEVAMSLATEPMRILSATPRTAETVRPPNQPILPRPVKPQPAAPATEVRTALTALPSPKLRGALETQSIPAELALAVTLPRTLPLTRSMAPALPANAAVASGIKAALLLGQTAFSPVEAALQKAEPATEAMATTLTATQVESLPAGGRRWQEFLLDTPAASASTDATQASYRGSQEPAEITIDGAGTSLKFGVAAGSGARASLDPANEGANQQSAMSESMSGWGIGGRGFGVSEAAIHEVAAVAGNVEAEGVRSAGGRTGIQTERGGDTLHGQGFLFDRQNTWGARNPFTQWVTETAPAGNIGMLPTVPVFDNGPTGPPQSYTPPDHETVWGLGMGSRIRRDKLFWFAALDSYHRNDPGLAMVKHPYLQAPTDCGTPPCAPTTTGFFAQPSDAQMEVLCARLGLTDPKYPGKICPNPVVEGLTAYSQMLEQLAGLLGPAPRTAAQWAGFGRIDWQAAERHRFTIEGTGADWNSPGGGLTRASENYGNHSFGSSHAAQQWLLARWEAYLTPNLLAVTQGSTGRAILNARPETPPPSSFEQTLLNGNFWGQLPQIVVDSRYGFTIGNPSRFGQGSYPDERLYHAQEMLDWVHGKLLVKAGFELDHNSDATSFLRNQTGTYVYSKVEDFISDALAFEKFGFADALDPADPHNCGPTDITWGSQPCYSYYSQTMGPTNWNLSTNDWAGYATAQWQAGKFAVFSGGLRWEREQLPPPIAALDNPELPFTEKQPDLGNNWGPRVSVAVGGGKRWPVLRLGYGMYYGRVENAAIETALTQTGSLKGDLSFFMRPQDDCQHCAGGAPPFPYVFAGQPASAVKPGVVGFAPNFRNPEVHQALASVEQQVPGGMELTAGAMLSLGRRLPVFIDTNFDPAVNPETITYDVCDEVNPAPPGANSNGQSGNSGGRCGNLGLGPIKAKQITVPFYASWPFALCPSGSKSGLGGQCGWLNPDYQEIDQITSEANSTYEGAMVKLTRYGRRGLSFHAHYTYAHAMDWNPNESPLDPSDFDRSSLYYGQEYGTSNLDVRHSAAVMAIYEAPWKLHNLAGKLGNGWMVSGIGQFRSGLPYTMRVTGPLPECFISADPTPCTTPSGLNTPIITNGTIVGLRPGINGSDGDSRVYGVGNNGTTYDIGRNTFRYPNTWKANLRLGKKFDFGEMRQLEILAESFNLFNHQNVTEIETTGYYIENSGSSGEPPTLNFLTGAKPGTSAFGQPLNINAIDFYRERQIQIGLRMRF